MTAPLRLESKDGIATITLAQPERMNALNFEMLDALVEALDAVGRGDDRVLVLAAEGRAFCAGADRAEMIERKPAEWEPIVDHYLDPVRRIADLDIPVIAKLQGDTVGGGFGLAIACDFRIAAEGIRLGAPFVRIGLAGCDMSAGYYLPRLIPLGAATEMMMTGQARARRRGARARARPPGGPGREPRRRGRQRWPSSCETVRRSRWPSRSARSAAPSISTGTRSSTTRSSPR